MKKLILICMSILLIIGATACENDSNSNKKTDTNVTAKNTNKEKVEDNKKAGKAFVNFGDTANTDKFNVKILEVKELNKIEANTSVDEDLVTDEKFIIIKLELKNISNLPQKYTSDDIGLTSTRAVYDMDNLSLKAATMLNTKEKIDNKNDKFISAYDKFNSGISKNTYVAFNVPKDLAIEDCAFGVITDKEPIYMYLK